MVRDKVRTTYLNRNIMKVNNLEEFTVDIQDGKIRIKHPNCPFETELVDKFPTYHLIQHLLWKVEELNEECGGLQDYVDGL